MTMKISANLLGVVVAATALIFSAIGCPPPVIPAEDVYQQIDSPEATYTFMKQAVTHDQKDVFYYLLASDVRKEYQFWMIQQGWSEIKKRVGVDVSKSKLLDVTYLDESPFPPNLAARLTIEYPHPSGEGMVVENFLCIMELDTKTYWERFPQWRVYYPYDPYQTRATWFRDLREQERLKPEGTQSGNANTTSGNDGR